MDAKNDYMQKVTAHAESLGMRPYDLCRAVGVADSTWYRWREGAHRPQLRTLEKLLAYQPPAEPAKSFRRGLA